ncbi:MAG: serpin family protein, partial [Candidatus Hydrothermarchaeaceae archaeon]
MIVLLPKNDDLKALEDSFTLEKLGQWKSEKVEQRVDVYMPKFTFDSKYFLNENLKEMGMPSAFTPKVADFSGMDGTKNLFISSVIHQAFVDVNEEGTEAAAATGVSMMIDSVPPPVPVFRADHPFIFMIQERGTGNILFLGRVVNPS